MSFLDPERLWLLAGVAALVAAYLAWQRRSRRVAARFAEPHLLDRLAPVRPGRRRHLPALAFAVMLALLAIAWARPAASARVPRERATIVIALDASGSMLARDVQPNRLRVAQQAALDFLDGLPERFNVGLVTFKRSASVVATPSTDREPVRAGIQNLRVGPNTAIGEAVFTALSSIASLDERAATDPPPARIVLLSDGGNTAGRPPEAAAQAAVAAGVPVSTIAYGTPNGRLGDMPVPVDGPSLQALAEATGGAFYEAATGEDLKEVYADIGSSIGFRAERRDISTWFVGIALATALAGAAASLAWFSRLP